MSHDRQLAILLALERKPKISLEDLQVELKTSRSTLRRDLVNLEHLGQVVRERGLVVRAGFEDGEPSFELRKAYNVEAKQAIAGLAATLVPSGGSVYLDAGSTCFELARELFRRTDLRVYTHSTRLFSLATRTSTPLVCIGGEYRRVSDCLVGGLSGKWLESLRFDICFVAASGLDEQGLTTTELSEMQMKSRILELAGRRVLVADGNKWDRPSVVRFAEWSAITDFVTDAALPRKARTFLKTTQVEVHVA